MNNQAYIIDQYSSNPAKSRNGGDYSFGRDFSRTAEGKWAVYYWTSAEFSFCSICGNFGDCQCSEEQREILDQLPEGAIQGKDTVIVTVI